MIRGDFLIHKYSDLSEEIFDTILNEKSFFIERIITNGQCTPEDTWLSQARAEFVMLLKGEARLRFRSDNSFVNLKAYEYIVIPPNCEHRVDWVSENEEVIWLAVHYDENL